MAASKTASLWRVSLNAIRIGRSAQPLWPKTGGIGIPSDLPRRALLAGATAMMAAASAQGATTTQVIAMPRANPRKRGERTELNRNAHHLAPGSRGGDAPIARRDPVSLLHGSGGYCENSVGNFATFMSYCAPHNRHAEEWRYTEENLTPVDFV